MSIWNMGIVKSLISKAITKLNRRKLCCESAATRFNALNVDRQDGNVTVQINVSVTMTEDDLAGLLDRAIEEL